MNRCPLAVILVFSTLFVWEAQAQSLRPTVEAGVGGAWFLDESAIEHTIGAFGLRWQLTPRLSVGPEITYMRGPGTDRDLTATGNIVFDFRRSGVTPYVVGGAGLFRHSDEFFGRTFSTTEGGFTAGGGVRIPLKSGWFIAPDVRIGWEPHTRMQITVGYRRP